VVAAFWSSDKVRRLLVALCLGTACLTSVGAQTYPDRAVRIVVPFAAGGGSDASGRAIALKLTEMLGQSFVVENRTGAAGSIIDGSAGTGSGGLLPFLLAAFGAGLLALLTPCVFPLIRRPPETARIFLPHQRR